MAVRAVCAVDDCLPSQVYMFGSYLAVIGASSIFYRNRFHTYILVYPHLAFIQVFGVCSIVLAARFART